MLHPAPKQIAQLMGLALDADHLPDRCSGRAAYRLVDILGVPENQLEQWGLSFPRPRRQGAALGKTQTNQVYRGATAYLMTEWVFSDTEKAQRFLTQPHPLLSGQAPIDLAFSDQSGLQEVESLLGRLYYGSAT